MELCRKEFDKSDENPFNQVHVSFDASKEEVAAAKDSERKNIESRLVK